jgi:hypothetical protein
MEAWVRYRPRPFGICGGRCGTGTGMSLSIYIFRWQCHSSPVLHTGIRFVYHRHCMLLVNKRTLRDSVKKKHRHFYHDIKVFLPPVARTEAVLCTTFLFSSVDRSQDYECFEIVSRFLLTLPQRRS